MEYSAWPEHRTGSAAAQADPGAGTPAAAYGTGAPPPERQSRWRRLFRGRRGDQGRRQGRTHGAGAAQYPPPPAPPQQAPPDPRYGPNAPAPQHPGYPQGHAGAGYAPAPQAPTPPQPQHPQPAAPPATAPAPWPQQQQPASAPAAPSAPAPEPSGAATPAEVRPRATHQHLLPKALANLAMRDLTLVESLLLLIQRMESREDDPEALATLYQIDHLGARMRRNCENLLVLAGEPIAAAHRDPVPLHDVVRAAMSEIDQYTRVQLQDLPQLHIGESAADDLSHLLAELMENALANSADDLSVTARGRYRDDGSLVLEIADDGIGIPPGKLERINADLHETPVLTDETLRHMGLFVVGLLAHRHGVEVQLQTRPFSGTSAYVHIPAGLVRLDVRERTIPSDAGAPTAPMARAQPASSSSPQPAEATPAPDEPLPELPKRTPGRPAPDLRVVDSGRTAAEEPPPAPDDAPAAEPSGDTAADPGELPPLPQRVPAARDQRPATEDTTDDEEFVSVRGRPAARAEDATGTSGSGEDVRSYAERLRAELDDYVTGRRDYQDGGVATGPNENGDGSGDAAPDPPVTPDTDIAGESAADPPEPPNGADRHDPAKGGDA